MANASEITGLFFFKAKHIPFMFGILSRSLTEILDSMGRIKAKWRRANEGKYIGRQNLSTLIKRRSHNARLGTRHTSRLFFAPGNENGDGIYQMMELIRLAVQLKFLSDLSDTY